MHVNRDTFDPEEVTRVRKPRRPVVLASGGPVMELESLDGEGRALCSWVGDDGKIARATFPLACLYRCRPADNSAPPPQSNA